VADKTADQIYGDGSRDDGIRGRENRDANVALSDQNRAREHRVGNRDHENREIHDPGVRHRVLTRFRRQDLQLASLQLVLHP